MEGAVLNELRSIVVFPLFPAVLKEGRREFNGICTAVLLFFGHVVTTGIDLRSKSS